MKVLKFGGASLKDGKSLKHICKIIAGIKGRKAVVFSAFNDVTNKLDSMLVQIQRKHKLINDNYVGAFTDSLRKSHLKYIQQAIGTHNYSPYVLSRLDIQCRSLKRFLYGLSYIDEITERSRDLILSFGERLSVICVAEVLRYFKIDAVPLEADKIGLITDGYFGRASAILPIARRNVRKRLVPLIKRRVVPVITGYFGCDDQGRTTTFGRGGSDYSAAVLAYALDAEELEIWKDVDGFMSANPAIIPHARLIEHLSYKEAVELAYFGSTILHPRTVEPVLLKNIPIAIRNTFAPDRQGTTIHNHSTKQFDGAAIKGITYESDIGIIKVHGYGAGFGYKSEVINAITGRLLEKKINIKTILSAPTGISLVLGKDDFEAGYAMLSKEKINLVAGFEKIKNQALIGLVGEGLVTKKGVAGRVFQALARQDINAAMISAGASSAAGYFIIDRRNLRKTVMLLYQEFFGK